MSKTDNTDHYEILYENEKGVRYGVFRSTDLDALGQAYARMLQFENMFRTFPNASCHLILTQDYNYDPDCGSFFHRFGHRRRRRTQVGHPSG